MSVIHSERVWTICAMVCCFYQCICRVTVRVTFIILNLSLLSFCRVVLNQRQPVDHKTHLQKKKSGSILLVSFFQISLTRWGASSGLADPNWRQSGWRRAGVVWRASPFASGTWRTAAGTFWQPMRLCLTLKATVKTFLILFQQNKCQSSSHKCFCSCIMHSKESALFLY